MSRNRFVAYAAYAVLLCSSVIAIADDHAYSEGPIVNVTRIRTMDYIKYLDTTWKREQEAAKKAGNIISYQVLTIEARGPDDPDVLLVITFKNWGTLDGALAKGDAIAKQIEGSLNASNQAQSDRSKIRRVLGSSTMQVLELK
jgi:hypothetical protein